VQLLDVHEKPINGEPDGVCVDVATAPGDGAPGSFGYVVQSTSDDSDEGIKRDERMASGYCSGVSPSSMLIFNVVLSPMMVFPTEMSTLQVRLM